MNYSGLKVIALDFDGTIVESNQIKDRAFETIFSEWPEHTENMMSSHLDNNSIERGEKFRYFVEEVLFLPRQNDLIEELILKFGRLTMTAIIECPYVKGAEEFLEYFSNRTAVYLVSATPQPDLNQIIKARGLADYFKDLYGAPINKIEILKQIKILENASENEILFIGDSPEDQQAANFLGIRFIGRQSDKVLNASTDPVFSVFYEITDFLKSHYDI